MTTLWEKISVMVNHSNPMNMVSDIYSMRYLIAEAVVEEYAKEICADLYVHSIDKWLSEKIHAVQIDRLEMS